jgi:hypothetical protein
MQCHIIRATNGLGQQLAPAGMQSPKIACPRIRHYDLRVSVVKIFHYNIYPLLSHMGPSRAIGTNTAHIQPILVRDGLPLTGTAHG